MFIRGLSVTLMILLVNADFGPKNANNYGYYVVEWEHFDQCRGPKMTNATKYINTLLINEENHYIGRINMTFLEDTRIDEIFIALLKQVTFKFDFILSIEAYSFLEKIALSVVMWLIIIVKKMKIYVYTMKETGKTLLWNYNINKPCQHYVFATLLEQHLGVKNCGAKKGNYFSDMDLTVLMTKYIGKQFFYGEYIFKVVINSKKSNIMCVYFDPKFKKKEKATT